MDGHHQSEMLNFFEWEIIGPNTALFAEGDKNDRCWMMLRGEVCLRWLAG